jgi:NAD(P)-dependent dehydrogenase (short-subunit alcohol dehydrogenase family)
MRALAADLKPQGIVVGIVAPGMVETDLLAASGYKGPAAIKAPDSVAGMMKVIDGLSFENNDKAVNYNGEMIPW